MSDTMAEPFALDRLLSNALDGVFVVDGQRRFVMFNEACQRLTGYSEAEMLGRQCACHDAVACEDEYGRSLGGSLCPGLAVFKGNLPSAKQRMQIRRKDGTNLWIETSYTPIKDESGRIECVLGIMRDISDSKEREDILRETTSDLRAEVDRLRQDMRQRYGFSTIISRSACMENVFRKIRAASTNSSSVLISGESGTGKEMVARAIHCSGLHKDAPFVAVNASALPRDLIESELFGHVQGAFTGATRDFPGLFRAAEGGTLFLDEIAEMTTETQAKLLRALQDKCVRPVGSTEEVPTNARVIAATNRNVSEAIRSGVLRQDLYYRLGVIAIELPPLRRRREDIPFLVSHMLDQFNKQSVRQVKQISHRAWDLLLSYDWPGNVRELQNAVESGIAIGEGDVLRAEDLPGAVRGENPDGIADPPAGDGLNLDEALRRVERGMIGASLRRAGGQRSKAAQLMGISRSRLYRRMEALGVDPNKEV